MYHALGYATMMYLQAVMTFQPVRWNFLLPLFLFVSSNLIEIWIKFKLCEAVNSVQLTLRRMLVGLGNWCY
jgi:hypothetical protein